MILGYNNIRVYMYTYQKQNFLKVCFDSYRGLRLDWNFKDFSANERYFRHIFVMISQEPSQTVSIVEELYKKMKSGDLFCCIYPHDTYMYKVGKWVEKSSLSNFKPERYLKQMSKRTIHQPLKLKMIEAAGKQSLQFNEPVVINFLGVQKNELDFYKNEIMRHRYALNPIYQYIVNLFGDFQDNSMSIHSGINVFKTNVTNFQDYAEYYHKMINAAAIQTAQIDITALNGQMNLFNSMYWRNTDFNRISATYFGPSAQFDTESIYFFNRQHNFDYQHEFQVKLKIKLFQHKVLESNKRLKINFFQTKDYCPTFNNSRFYCFYSDKNIQLSENPNKCQLIVKYKSNKYLSGQNDDF